MPTILLKKKYKYSLASFGFIKTKRTIQTNHNKVLWQFGIKIINYKKKL